MPAPRPRKISDFKPLFTNLAQTSHYQVSFGGLSANLRSYLLQRGIDSRFVGESVGLLCNSASLPGSSFATSDIVGNYMGVSEKFAHTRAFTQIDLEFYVDRSYRTLKFLEHWMEFISSGSLASPYNESYYFRMRYPEEYKTNTTKIVKFDRDYKNFIEYTFYGLFPLSLNSTPVTYESSSILKASASFSYERYVCGRTLSIDIFNQQDNNRVGTPFLNAFKNNGPVLVPRTGQSLGNESGVRLTYTPPGSVIPQVVDPYFREGSLGQNKVTSNRSVTNGEVIGSRRVI